MKNILDILILLIAVVLPMALGYFFRLIKLFDDKEIDALRKFVIKVSVPFLIFKNLYKANIQSLGQFFPMATAFFVLTALYTVSGYYLSGKISTDKSRQNAFAFSVMAGNYMFLGWGVVFSFYGENALTRAMFFTILFWPVFLLCGFFMIHLRNRNSPDKVHSFGRVLFKNASVPVITSALAIVFNLSAIPVPTIAWDFVEKFAAFTIPMILFTIGLNFRIRLPASRLKVLLSATFYRLILGFVLGFATLFLVRLIFPVDGLTQKVILLQCTMPTATMTVFFAHYAEIDNELHSGIIAFSTLLSLATIPAWYILIERFF